MLYGMDESCAVCGHRYGDHYETFDGEFSPSCDADMGGPYFCKCEGFLEANMATYIHQVTMHPSDFDGPENDIVIGYYQTQRQAERAAADWIQKSERPHPYSRMCDCVWVPSITPILLNTTRHYYGRT